MQRMQKEWREEERRRKEKMEEEGLENDVDDDEEGVDALLNSSKTKKKTKGKRKDGGAKEGEEGDIWAGIKAKPISVINPQGGLVGLHDVVQAPPKLVKGKLKDISSLGRKGGGGLKRAGELSEARKGVVEGYRALMRERREEMG